MRKATSTGYYLDTDLVEPATSLPHINRADVRHARELSSNAATAAVLRAVRVDEGVTIESHVCAGGDGHPVELRVYLPERRASRAAIYHVHGGGFILGDLETNHLRNLEIAREVGVVVVAVNYRLAPEWPFPTPAEDVYSGLQWLHQRVAGWDIDPSLVVLHGVSAGGCLAAATAMLARDRNGPPIAQQFLASPMLDDRLSTDSSRRFTDTPALVRGDLDLLWSMYLGEVERGGDAVPPYAAPARAKNFRRLPPAYVAVAEFDPLRDEAIEFARALLAAGVPVELHVFPGTYHGSVAVREAAVSRRESDEEIAVLRSMVEAASARVQV